MAAAGLMVSANAWLAVAWLLSVAWMVKFEAAAVVGGPLIRPVTEFNKRPPGKDDPTLTAQVYSPLPPMAVKVCEQFTPTWHVGNGEVVVIARVTGTVKDPEVESLLLSVTFTVN